MQLTSSWKARPPSPRQELFRRFPHFWPVYRLSLRKPNVMAAHTNFTRQRAVRHMFRFMFSISAPYSLSRLNVRWTACHCRMNHQHQVLFLYHKVTKTLQSISIIGVLCWCVLLCGVWTATDKRLEL